MPRVNLTNSKSSLSRIVSASAASWVRIIITIVTQLTLVPLYLSNWTPEEYGAWLLLQATWAVITSLDMGHQDYVGYECLRLGTNNRIEIARAIFSAAPIALLITLIDIFFIFVLGKTGLTEKWMNHDIEIASEWQAALLLQATTFFFTASIGGLIVRGLAPFGHFPRIAWWGTINALFTSIVPGIAVSLGANLWEAMVALCAANISYYIIHLADMIRIMRLESFFQARPQFKLGFSQGGKSLWLILKSLAEVGRQQGVRILLAPLAGVADMAAFSTMRTGANFAMQGLNTITGPIMPELMRYLVARDQQRTEGAFSVVWLVICIGLSPAVLIVQYFAPEFFPIWTHGKITFDPWVFGMLSVGILLAALVQPAVAVILGNNIVRTQLYISLLGALITIGALLMLVPLYKIRGAALALLLAEIVNLLAYQLVATRWLRKNNMSWPWRAFLTAFASVIIAGIGMAVLAATPSNNLEFLLMILLAEATVTVVYWHALPQIARKRALELTKRFKPKPSKHI
ncbi:MAG: hypothetical protein D4R94_04370 [Chitinophagaceae bacterium]|nr:MAG: hypothetical protein D4R94_04370 [Chitinophagaceae bacterium]